MIKEEMVAELRQSIRPYFTEERYAHTLRVEKEIRYLAAHLLPEEETLLAVAALLHDLTKKMPLPEQVRYCALHGVPCTEEELAAPQLLHAKTAPLLIREKFPALAHPVLLSAIEKHTTGDRGMTRADILLYLADFTEEGRTYEDCVTLRRMLHEGLRDAATDKDALLDRVLLAAYDCSLSELIAAHRPISTKTVAARNELLAKMAEKNKA